MEGMPNPEDITSIDLIVVANRGLLCYIHPNMRQVNIEYIKEKRNINFYVYFDTQPTDDQIDDIGNVITEMSCQFPEEINWQEHIVILPYPNRIPDKGICVFRRYEPSPD